MYQELIAHLNRNSGAYITLLTVVLTIATAAYAWLTWRMLRETMRIRELQHKPEIVASLEGVGNFNPHLYLTLRNVGNATAFDLRLSIQPDMVLHNRNLSEMGEFKNGIPYVRAGGSWRIYLTHLHSSETRDQAATDFVITVEYKDAEQKPQERTYKLGTLTAAADFYGSEPDSLESIRLELEHLREHFERQDSSQWHVPRTLGRRNESVVAQPGSRNQDSNAFDVAQLAYTFWQIRGQIEGTPEEDWFRAEQYLRTKRSGDHDSR